MMASYNAYYTVEGRVFHRTKHHPLTVLLEPWGWRSSSFKRPWAGSKPQTNCSFVRVVSCTSPCTAVTFLTNRSAPNYTALWQRYMCAINLPKVVTWQRNDRKLNQWQHKCKCDMVVPSYMWNKYLLHLEYLIKQSVRMTCTVYPHTSAEGYPWNGTLAEG